MQDPFRRVRAPAVDPFRRLTPQQAQDVAPVKQTYLPWQEAVYRFISNIPRSALENVKDAAMLVRPVGKAAHGESTAVVGDWTAFPGLQDLGALVGQAGIAGVEKATGADIMPEKRVLDGLIEFYKANYGLGPEGMKGFERFVTEDPVGFLTDLMMFASVGSAAPSVGLRAGKRAATTAKALKAGEAFTDAWKQGKAGVAYENYAPFIVKVDHVLNRGFAVPSRLEGLFSGIPIVRRRMRDVPVSFGERAGETGRGFQMGLAEVGDPAAHVFRGTLGRAGRMLGKTLQERQPAASAAERRGVDLPVSAKAVSPAAAAAEAVRLKADDPEMHARVMGVYESLDRIAEETVNKISDASDPDVAATLAVQGYEAYTQAFRVEMDKLYDGIEDLNRIPAVLAHTKEFFDQFAADAAQAEPLTGRQEYSTLLHSIRENVEAYAAEYPDIVEQVMRGGGEGGGTPPGVSPGTAAVRGVTPAPSGKGDGAADVAVRRAHRGNKARMVKGNWGGKYQAEYAVVELDDLIQSHLPDGSAENPLYDPNLQPRDRTDASSRLQVEDIANNLDPDLMLDDTSSMNDGAPIIGDDLMVESGNGRIMAMKQAAASPVLRPRLEVYKRQLLADLDLYGLTADDVGAMRMPVLVRRRITDVDRTEFVKEANDSSGKAFRSAEGAAMDARLMDRDLLQTFSFGDETTLRAALKASRNNEFVNGFVAKFPNDKQGAFFDETGRVLTDEGYARIERAMLLSVFDETFGAVMASRFADVGDAGLLNIRKAIYAALPELAQLRYLIESGERRSELAPFEDIAQAVLKVRELIEAGDTASFARRQGRMFTGAEWGDMYDDLSDDAARILLMVERGKEAPSELTEFLKWYAREIDAQGSTQQLGMFEADVAPVTKAEILQTALGREFENIPDIEELRRAFRDEAPVDQAPEGDSVGPDVVRRARARLQEQRRTETPEQQQTWLRRVYANQFGHDLGKFSEYMHNIFNANAEQARRISGFESAEQAIDWVRQNALSPEQVETRVQELRIEVRQGKPISLKGREFDSFRELAVLSQALRDASIEWSHVFYVRRVGNVHHIVGQETTTLGSGNQTRTRGYGKIHEQMEALEADGVVFLHNHPGATAEFSRGDKGNHQAKEVVFGDAYIGDLVINSGTYAAHLRGGGFDGDMKFYDVENERLSAEELGWDPNFSRHPRFDIGGEMWHPHIRQDDPLFREEGELGGEWMSGQGFSYSYNSVQDVIKNLGFVGRALKIDNNWVVLNMVSSWNRLNAAIQVRGDQLAQLAPEQRVRFLRELAQQYGGDQVHVFVGKGDWYQNRQQAWDMFSNMNQDPQGGGIMSVMVHGQKSAWVNRETDFYRRAWRSGPLEEVSPVEGKPGIAEHGTERRFLSQIYRDKRLRPGRDVGGEDNPFVYVSNGKLYRSSPSRNVGFVFDPKRLTELGVRFSDKWSRFEGMDTDKIQADIKAGNWDALPEGLEFRIEGDLPLSEATGVIEKGQVVNLTAESVGKDPLQWQFEDGRTIHDIEGHAGAVVADVSKPEPRGRRRVAMEHMTGGEEQYRQILADKRLKRPGVDEDRVWISMGPFYRRNPMHRWGFIFSTNKLEEAGTIPYDFNMWWGDLNKWLRQQREQGNANPWAEGQDKMLRRFMNDTGKTLEEAHQAMTELEGHSEFVLNQDLELSNAVAVVENGQVKVITEETRGKDPSEWQYREPTDDDLADTAMVGEGEPPGIMSEKPEPRGLPSTRQRQLPELLWESVKRTRTIVGDALFSKNPDPIVSREERFYKQLYDALTADLSEAVARHAPDRVGEFEEISRRYAEGRAKINEGWGLKILRSAQKGEQEKLVRAIFKPDMPVEQIPLVYELFGGKDSEGGRAMQSAFIRELLKKSKSADGAWLPQALRRQLNNHGDKRLRAFFDDETVSALNDMADISLSMADFAKMAHGSQTAFLAREMLEGSMFGGALQKLAWRIGTGPVGWLLMFADIVGQEAATRFFTSPEGEAFLMRGGVRTAIGEGMQWLTEGAQGQLARAANRSIEGQ